MCLLVPCTEAIWGCMGISPSVPSAVECPIGNSPKQRRRKACCGAPIGGHILKNHLLHKVSNLFFEPPPYGSSTLGDFQAASPEGRGSFGIESRTEDITAVPRAASALTAWIKVQCFKKIMYSSPCSGPTYFRYWHVVK